MTFLTIILFVLNYTANLFYSKKILNFKFISLFHYLYSFRFSLSLRFLHFLFFFSPGNNSAHLKAFIVHTFHTIRNVQMNYPMVCMAQQSYHAHFLSMRNFFCFCFSFSSSHSKKLQHRSTPRLTIPQAITITSAWFNHPRCQGSEELDKDLEFSHKSYLRSVCTHLHIHIYW